MIRIGVLLVIGAFIGWFAAALGGRGARQGALLYVVAGIAGAGLGNIVFRLVGLGETNINAPFDRYSALFSAAGALLVVGGVASIARMRARSPKMPAVRNTGSATRP